jgi:transposase
VVDGVDTHADTHPGAVVLMNGRRVADREFPATRAGYVDLLDWMRSFGRVHAVGVEGSGSYGAGLARHLAGAKVKVVEVNRPDRRQRRTKRASPTRWTPMPLPKRSWPTGPARSPEGRNKRH